MPTFSAFVSYRTSPSLLFLMSMGECFELRRLVADDSARFRRVVTRRASVGARRIQTGRGEGCIAGGGKRSVGDFSSRTAVLRGILAARFAGPGSRAAVSGTT